MKTGKNCFFLSAFCSLVMVLVCAYIAQGTYFSFLSMYMGVMGLVYLLLFLLILMKEWLWGKMGSEGLKHGGIPRRYRLEALLIAFMCLILWPMGVTLEDAHNLYLELFSGTSPFFPAAVYFFSCTPKPPGPKKEKKSIFQTT